MSARRMFRIALAALGLLVVAGLGAGLWFLPFWKACERIAARPESGFSHPYWLHVGQAAAARCAGRQEVALLVIPNNTGRPDDDPEVHVRSAWWRAWRYSGMADALGVALLVPCFPRPAAAWEIYTHALDRDALTTKVPGLERLDLQLVACIDDANARLAARGARTDPRVLLHGFSANAMFADRFTALHPRRVRALAAGSPGGWPIAPVAAHAGERLPYPAGIADLEELVRVPFDQEAYAAVPQFLYVGELDQNDSLAFTDGWDQPAAAQVRRLFAQALLPRWEAAHQLRRAAAPGALWRVFAGAAHRNTAAMQAEVTRFLARALAR